MPKHRDLNRGDVFPASFVKASQEFIGTDAINFRLTPANATTLRGVAGASDDQAALGIDGLWRYRAANHDVAHPGGAAGVYEIYAVASANEFTNAPVVDTDNTDYNWYLQILPTGNLPAGNTPAGKPIVAYRKVGEVDWSGTQITGIRQFVGQVDARAPATPSSPIATVSAIRAKAFSVGQSAAVIQVDDALGAAKFTVSDAGLVDAAAGYRVNGVALAASHLSNGTTGTGAVVLANAPTITGLISSSGDITIDHLSGTVDAVLTVTARVAGVAVVGTVKGTSVGTAINAPVGKSVLLQIGGTDKVWVQSTTLSLASGMTIFVGGSQYAASHLANGTTGTGAVVLASGPTLAGTLTHNGATITATAAALQATFGSSSVYDMTMFVNGRIQQRRAVADLSTYAYQLLNGAESFARWRLSGDGLVEWGGGAGNPDASLSRIAARQMRFWADSLTIRGDALATNPATLILEGVSGGGYKPAQVWNPGSGQIILSPHSNAPSVALDGAALTVNATSVVFANTRIYTAQNANGPGLHLRNTVAAYTSTSLWIEHTAQGDSTGYDLIAAQNSAGARFRVRGDGVVFFKTTNLYEVAATELKTDGYLESALNIYARVGTAGEIRAGESNTTATIFFGNDGLTKLTRVDQGGLAIDAVSGTHDATLRLTGRNGGAAVNGFIAVSGGGSMYLDVPTSGTFVFRVNGTTNVTVGQGGVFVAGRTALADGGASNVLSFFGSSGSNQFTSPTQVRVGSVPGALTTASTLSDVIAVVSRLHHAIQNHGLIGLGGVWSS